RIFCLRPEKKLSTQITSSPEASSRSHKWLPRNPAPPVTRIVDMTLSFSCCFKALRGVPGSAESNCKIRQIDKYRHLQTSRGEAEKIPHLRILRPRTIDFAA